MRKHEFLAELTMALNKTMPKNERETAVGYYCDLIDEAVSNGKDEELFISSLPAPKEIAKRLTYEMEGAEPQIDDEEIPSAIAKIFDEPVQAQQQAATAQTYAPMPVIPHAAPKKKRHAPIIPLIIGGFFYAIIVLPIMLSLIVSVAAVLVSLWAAAGSLVLSGAIIPIYAVAAGFVGESMMVFITYLAVGFLVLGLGLLSVWIMAKGTRVLSKVIVWLCKASLYPFGLRLF